ncbi:hypothetical protein H311_00027, partial [Anncaliia algerae PRA109]
MDHRDLRDPGLLNPIDNFKIIILNTLMNLKLFEETIGKYNCEELMNFCMLNNIFKKKMKCTESCLNYMKLEKASKYIDKYAWRCYNKNCNKYKQRKSIRTGSNFININLSMHQILKILLMFSCNISKESIVQLLSISPKSLKK